MSGFVLCRSSLKEEWVAVRVTRLQYSVINLKPELRQLTVGELLEVIILSTENGAVGVC